MLTLFQFELSPYCDKVRRVLRYKAVPFEVVEVSLFDARRQSPTGKLPALLDGDKRIDDSTRIARYVEDKHPEPALIPADPAQRARCHVLEDWADESLYFYDIAAHFSLRDNALPRIDAMTVDESPARRWMLRRLMPTLMRHVAFVQGTGRRAGRRLLEQLGWHMEAIEAWLDPGPWLLGGELSLADIAVSCQLDAIRATPEGRALVDGRAIVVDWQRRVRAMTGG